MRTLICLLALALSPSAFAVPNLKVTCVPTSGLEKALPVSWDEIRRIDSVVLSGNIGSQTKVEVRSRAYDEFSAKERDTLDVYSIEPHTQTMLLRDSQASNGLSLAGVTFLITDIKMPPSAGPPIPGDYAATATLVLVAAHRPGPGLPEQLETRSIDLSCRYVFSL